MNGHTYFIRCGDCLEMYVALENLLNGEPLWTRPKAKRGGCQHPVDVAQTWNGSAWITQGEPVAP